MTDVPPGGNKFFERVGRFFEALIPAGDDVMQFVRRGEALLAAGDPDGALRMADTVLAMSPGLVQAVLLRADAFAMRNEPQLAMQWLEAVSRERTLTASALARMVLYASLLGDEKRALELESHARARLRGRDRETALRLLQAAHVLIARQSNTGGLRLARAATLADASLGAAWLPLAHDAFARGHREQARRALDQAISTLDPTDAPTNRAAGEMALALEDLGAAVRCLRRAWIAGDAHAVDLLVLALARAHDRDALTRLLADVQGPAAAIARAILALSMGDDAQQARACLEPIHATELSPAIWSAALDLALQVSPDIAERWATEAPERPGSQSVLQLALSQRAVQNGDGHSAREMLSISLRDSKTSQRAHEVYEQACKVSWRGKLGTLLEELAMMLREHPALASFEAELRDLRRELDRPLRLAILGEFSAGKSTFLNALAGAEVSPMGVLPTTARVHWLRYGEPGAMIACAQGSPLAATIEEVPNALERLATEGRAIEHVEICLPLPRLARIELIDTPGFNAGEPDHETTVRRAFDMADVALWVFDARQAGRNSETGPIEEARAQGLAVLGALNKIDQIKPNDRPKVMSLLRDGFAHVAPLAFAVSAREGLAATLAMTAATEPTAKEQARERLERSGMVQALEWIDTQLVDRRAEWKLYRVARRLEALLRELTEQAEKLRAEAAGRTMRLDAILSAIAVLRGVLYPQVAEVRREVSAVLSEQLRGLARETQRTQVGSELVTLVNDAAAEIAFRARARAMQTLSPPLRELEGLVGSMEAATMQSLSLQLEAHVTGVLERAAAEGVRDATAGEGIFARTVSLEMTDPFLSWEQSIIQRERKPSIAHDTLHTALRVAVEMCAGFAVPNVTTATNDG